MGVWSWVFAACGCQSVRRGEGRWCRLDYRRPCCVKYNELDSKDNNCSLFGVESIEILKVETQMRNPSYL